MATKEIVGEAVASASSSGPQEVDSATSASRTDLARGWFSRRRRLAGSEEWVLTTLNSLPKSWADDRAELEALGFAPEPTVLRLTQRDGAHAYTVDSWREASGSPEVAIYTFLPANAGGNSTGGATVTGGLLRPMLSASDVLVVFCYPTETETALVLHEVQLLTRMTPCSIKGIVLVNFDGSEGRDRLLEWAASRTGAPSVAISVIDESDFAIENRWINLLQSVEKLVATRASIATENTSSVQSLPDSMAASTQKTLDEQVEAAIYSAAMNSSARRVVLFDGPETLIATEDLFDATTDWEARDQQIALRTAVFERDELMHLVLATPETVFTLDAAALTPGLRIGAFWSSQLDMDDIRVRARALSATVEGELARIGEGS